MLNRVQVNHLPEHSGKEGVFTYISHDWDFSRYLAKKPALKILKDNTPIWKKKHINDISLYQNLLSYSGIVPRVHDVLEIILGDTSWFAQVVEFIDGDPEMWTREKGMALRDACKQFHLTYHPIDPNKKNYINGMLVDTDSLDCSNPQALREVVIKMVSEKTGWGSNPLPYQSIKDLGIKGQRDVESRSISYRLGNLDFKNKSVIDFGCSSGEMLRDAKKRGAREMVGIDLPGVIEGARLASDYLGYFDIGFLGGNYDCKGGHSQEIYQRVVQETKEVQFDIVYYLSAQQLGFPEYLGDITREVAILEGHVPDKEETYRPQLEKMFNQVEFIGASRDHGPRPVFICRK